jgi:hypothetical protein
MIPDTEISGKSRGLGEGILSRGGGRLLGQGTRKVLRISGENILKI